MKKHNLIIQAILVIGLLIRIWSIDLPLLEFYPTRQVHTAEITRNLYKEGFKLFRPSVHFYGPGEGLVLLEFPIYNLTVSLFYFITGNVNEYYGRLLSIFGWGISAIFLYKLTLRYTSILASLVSTFIYTFSPLSVLISRSFQPDQWMLTFSIASIYFMNEWLIKEKRLFFLLSSVCISISLLLKIQSVIYIFLPIIYLISNKMIKRKNIILNASCFIVALLPSIIWYVYAFSLKQRNLAVEGMFTISNWFRPELFLNPKYYSNIFGFEYNLVLLPIGIFLLIIGLVSKLKKRQFLLYAWLAGVILYFIVLNRQNMVHEYYHLPFIPIAAIFIGIGVEKLFKAFNGLFINKYFLLLTLAFLYFISAIIVVINRGYQVVPRFRYVLETAAKVKSLTKPNDLIVGVMDSGPTLVYYSERTGWDFDINSENSISRLEKLRGEGAVIFASAYKNQFLENKEFAKYMYRNYDILKETDNYIIFGLTSNLD